MNQDPPASELPASIQNRNAEPQDGGSLRPEDDRLRQAMAPIMEWSVIEVLELGSRG